MKRMILFRLREGRFLARDGDRYRYQLAYSLADKAGESTEYNAWDADLEIMISGTLASMWGFSNAGTKLEKALVQMGISYIEKKIKLGIVRKEESMRLLTDNTAHSPPITDRLDLVAISEDGIELVEGALDIPGKEVVDFNLPSVMSGTRTFRVISREAVRLIDYIVDFFLEHNNWPPTSAVLADLYDQMDIENAVSSLQPDILRCADSHLGGKAPCSLKIKGVMLSSRKEANKELVQVLRAIYEFKNIFLINKMNPDNAKISSAQLQQRLGISDDEIIRLTLLLANEGEIAFGSGDPTDLRDWTFTIPRTILRFGEVDTIEQYIELKEKNRLKDSSGGSGRWDTIIHENYEEDQAQRQKAKPEVEMPRRTTDTSLEVKSWTAPELRLAIKKLRRRVDDVKQVDTQNTAYNDPSVDSLEERIKETIRDVFGISSPEYQEHQYFSLSHGPVSIGMQEENFQDNFKSGVRRAAVILEGLVKGLEEKLEDLGEHPESRAYESFKGLDLHPQIASAVAGLFKDGHYPNAVFDACKALIKLVKEKSKRHDLDGTSLMQSVFSIKNPILRFNELKDKTEKDEQLGMMYLYSGAVLALRNPRGHSFPLDSAERALEDIALINLLAKRLAEATLAEEAT